MVGLMLFFYLIKFSTVESQIQEYIKNTYMYLKQVFKTLINGSYFLGKWLTVKHWAYQNMVDLKK